MLTPGKSRYGLGLGLGIYNMTPKIPGDAYPAPVAGFLVSTVQVKTGFPCMRIRRESDNAEQDIGFSGGVRDDAALATFCAGTHGRVVRWYDQFGNNDLVRTTASQQPYATSALGTAAVDDNGMPTVLFGVAAPVAGNYYLQSEFDVGDSDSKSLVVVFSRTDALTGSDHLCSGTLSEQYAPDFNVLNVEFVMTGATNTRPSILSLITEDVSLAMGLTGGPGEWPVYKNGVLQSWVVADESDGAVWNDGMKLRVGNKNGAPGNSDRWNGTIGEVYISDSAISLPAITAARKAAFSIP